MVVFNVYFARSGAGTGVGEGVEVAVGIEVKVAVGAGVNVGVDVGASAKVEQAERMKTGTRSAKKMDVVLFRMGSILPLVIKNFRTLMKN